MYFYELGLVVGVVWVQAIHINMGKIDRWVLILNSLI